MLFNSYCQAIIKFNFIVLNMSKFLGLNIPDELDNAIAQRVKEAKKTKTEIVIMALQKELDIQTVLTLADRVEILEQKVCAIEGKI